MIEDYRQAPTVKEVIEVLQKLPQDLPCYFRPKYRGTVYYVDAVPLLLSGICEMENSVEKHVTFLV